MRKRIKGILGTGIMFAALIYLGQNPYLLEWLAERYFCFIWVPIMLFWIIKQDVLARWLWFGAYAGLIIGQISENLKWNIHGSANQVAHSSYWGVGVWFTSIIIAFGFGILHTWIKIKTKKKSTSES